MPSPMEPPQAGSLNYCPPPAADRFMRPGDRTQPPIQSVLATNAQARNYLRKHDEEMQRTGEWSYDPTVGKAHREAERSRIGRPGGSTFTKDNIAAKREE